MRQTHRHVFLTAAFALVAGFATAQPAAPEQQPLFTAGAGGYNTYRIPALVVTNNKTVLAFCEGRKNGQSDTGNIDLLFRRSTDNGKTWSEAQVLWDDGDNCCGNPAPVVDRETGRICLLMTWNRGDDKESDIISQRSKDTRRVFLSSSEDDGATWSKPADITDKVKQDDWTWYATGPGAGIQLEQGPHKGRMVVACDHIEVKGRKYYSHVIFSDDHGKTWTLGGRTAVDKVNECLAVELAGGAIMLNMRNYDRKNKCRQAAISKDGGLTWQPNFFAPELVEPLCQAGIHRHAWPQPDKPGMLVFSNPADAKDRINMTVRYSRDEGKTWSSGKQLHPGPGAYSDLATMPDGAIACLYESGQTNPYETIQFARFGLDWLTAP